MNARDRVPLTLVTLLLLFTALAALLAPFVLADPGPTEPLPDTAQAPSRPPVQNIPATPGDVEARVRMAGTAQAEAFAREKALAHDASGRMADR